MCSLLKTPHTLRELDKGQSKEAKAGETTVTDPKRHIVRPFGLIGGRYEVDDASLMKYRISCFIAVVIFGLFLLRTAIGIPSWQVYALMFAGIAVILWLCLDVVRNGKKL